MYLKGEPGQEDVGGQGRFALACDRRERGPAPGQPQHRQQILCPDAARIQRRIGRCRQKQRRRQPGPCAPHPPRQRPGADHHPQAEQADKLRCHQRIRRQRIGQAEHPGRRWQVGHPGGGWHAHPRELAAASHLQRDQAEVCFVKGEGIDSRPGQAQHRRQQHDARQRDQFHPARPSAAMFWR